MAIAPHEFMSLNYCQYVRHSPFETFASKMRPDVWHGWKDWWQPLIATDFSGLKKLSYRLLTSYRIAASIPSKWLNIPSQFEKQYRHLNLSYFDANAIFSSPPTYIGKRDYDCLRYAVNEAPHTISLEPRASTWKPQLLQESPPLHESWRIYHHPTQKRLSVLYKV